MNPKGASGPRGGSGPRDGSGPSGGEAAYVDTSALAKLVVAEEESAALLAWVTEAQGSGLLLISSDLARTELLRLVRRHAPGRMRRARDVLDGLHLLTLPPDIFDAAALIDPIGLRSLDAVHLAAALDLGDSLHGLVAYDHRLADAARAVGIRVIAPGTE